MTVLRLLATQANEATGEREFSPVHCCPYLGLRLDPSSVFLQPTEEHRCYRGVRPWRIDLQHQRGFCLGPACASCPRRLGQTEPAAQPRRWLSRRTAQLVIGLLIVLVVVVAARATLSATAPAPPPPPPPAAADIVQQDVQPPSPREPEAERPSIVNPPITQSTTVWRTLLNEQFVAPPSGWPDKSNSTAWWSGDKYHLAARDPGHFVAIAAPLGRSVRNVEVSARFRKLDGPPGGGYGLIVRDQTPDARNGLDQLGQYYVLEVGDRGEIGAWRRDGDRWIDLLRWTRSDAVYPDDQPNFLKAQAIGEQLRLYVNGDEVLSVEDASLPTGGVGVFVGGDGNQVVLENYLVLTLDP